MASTKLTFTLDQETVQRIDRAAARLSPPKSRIVRDAVLEYYERLGRWSESKRFAHAARLR